MHAAGTTRPTAFRLEPALALERKEGVQTAIGTQDDAAAIAAVAAVGTAHGHELLASKMHGPVSAAAGLDMDGGLIKKRVHGPVPFPHTACCFPARCPEPRGAAGP